MAWSKVKGFLKSWTLIVAMGMGTAVYLAFAYVPPLEDVGRVCGAFLRAVFPVFMFLILFVTFCKVDFRQMRPHRWHLRVCVAQLVMVAAIIGAILLLFSRGTGKTLLESVLACVICPTAAAAAVITVKLGGEINSMTTYTLISNLMASVAIPVFLPLIEKEAGITFAEALLTLLGEVLTVLVLPLLLAFIVRHYMPRLHAFITGVKDLGFYLWAVSLSVVTGITVSNLIHSPVSHWLLLAIASASLVTCLFQYSLGKLLGRGYGASVNSGQGLGQKNTVFAIWMASTYLNPVATLGPGCYILWQNLFNGWQLSRMRGTGAK